MPVPYSAATDAFEEARRRREEKEMQRALAADGEKLRQLTGEDHGPWGTEPEEAPQQWFVCDACDGSGEEVFGYWGYDPGCGHGRMMDDGRPCRQCKGDGGWLDDVKPDHT